MATLQLGEEVAHALIRNLAGNDNIPDRNSIRGWAPSLWLGWVKTRRSLAPHHVRCIAETGHRGALRRSNGSNVALIGRGPYGDFSPTADIIAAELEARSRRGRHR